MEEHQHNAQLQEINDEIEKIDLNMDRVGSLVSDYIMGGPDGEHAARAIWLTVSMAKQVKHIVRSEIPKDRLADKTFRVQLIGQQFDERTGESLDKTEGGDRIQAEMNFALHVCEHLCNDEWELFYNHLLELSVEVDAYLHLITGMIYIYNRMSAIESGKGRIKSVIIDENGIETINDRGNTNLGGAFPG